MHASNKKMLLTMFIITMAITLAGAAHAAGELILAGKVDSIKESVDKNGNTYVRMNVLVEKELNGIKYEAPSPVMCFGESLAKRAKTYVPGTPVKVIATESDFKGRTSYTAIAFTQ